MLTIFLRTIIIFIALFLMMRLLGKRQLGELELSELVVSFLIADVASIPLQEPDLPLVSGLLPSATLIACEYLLSLGTMKSVTLRRMLCGKPCYLIVNGIIQQKNMRQCRLTVDELGEELRSRDVTDISTVQYAVLETDGSLNVILYPSERPVTAGQLNLSPEDDGYATILVENGTVLRHNLVLVGKDEKWLDKELKKRGCSLKQVYVLILFESGKIYFAEKN